MRQPDPGGTNDHARGHEFMWAAHLKDTGSSASASASESLARRLRMFLCLPDGITLHVMVPLAPQASLKS
jgi:hypothetical protein